MLIPLNVLSKLEHNLKCELVKANDMVPLLGIIAVLQGLNKVPHTFFKYALEMYLEQTPGAAVVIKKKVEHLLGVQTYNWWMAAPVSANTWGVQRCPCQYSSAFEAADEDDALTHIEVVFELKTHRHV